jgi:argininosuccinate lyase
MGIARRSLEIMSLVMAEVTPKKDTLMKSLSPELFATSEANKLVKKGMPFRDAYQQVKEHLGDLKVPDLVAALKEVTSIGGPGNLQLSKYKLSKPL